MQNRLRTVNFGTLFSEGVEPEPEAPPAKRRQRRQAALRETFGVKAQRLLRVAAHLAQPKRAADLPAAFAFLLRRPAASPARRLHPRGADQVAGLAVDLAPAAMMEAYSEGLAPSACLGPVAWQSRGARLVAAPAALMGEAVEHNSADADWGVSFDRDIDLILARSGRPSGGPIMPARLLEAFAQLFDAGFVHCFAVRDLRGQLIGGGFGVAVGGVFIIEGAFANERGAAAFGLARLSERLAARKFAWLECAPALAWLGGGAFRAITREAFVTELALHMGEEQIGRWRSEASEQRLAA